MCFVMARSDAPAGPRDGRIRAASLAEIGALLEEAARLVHAHALDPSADLLALAEHGALPETNPRWVRALLDVRRLRTEFLGVPVTDTALTILLELYAAALEQRPLSRAGLADAPGLAHATLASHVTRLEAATLVAPPADPAQAPALTPTTAKNLRAWLAAAAEIAGAAV
jgi:hypothetical protein